MCIRDRLSFTSRQSMPIPWLKQNFLGKAAKPCDSELAVCDVLKIHTDSSWQIQCSPTTFWRFPREQD
eukprot:7337646-Pyramimonas_sp.AAC.1